MNQVKKPGTLTLSLLIIFLLALFSYFFFPQPLYFFHKNFLNKYTPGLSLAKPLLFFLFLFLASLARDLLPKANFSIRKWLISNAIIIAAAIMLASAGFAVFNHNLSSYNTVFPNSTIPANAAGVMYVSYKAQTPFFYTISETSHNHENKALFFPAAKLFKIEGDFGEAVYPFYPKPLMLAAYALLAIAAIAFLHCLRLLHFAQRRLGTILAVYYAFVIWRIFHIVFDGGIFNVHVIPDLLSFLFILTLPAYVAYPNKPVATISPYLAIFSSAMVQVLAKKGISIAGITIGTGGLLLQLALLEPALVLSIITLLPKLPPKFSTAIKDRTFILATSAAVIFLFLCVMLIATANVRTALDPADSYAKQPQKAGAEGDLLALTTLSAANPCNQNPVNSFEIKDKFIKIYNLSANLDCDGQKYYAYPLSREDLKQARLVLKCDNDGIINARIQKSGDTCHTTLKNNYSFFRFEAAPALAERQVFWAFKPAKQTRQP